MYVLRNGDTAEPEPAESGVTIPRKGGQLVEIGRGAGAGQQQQLESLSRVVEAGHPLSKSPSEEWTRPERPVTGERAVCRER